MIKETNFKKILNNFPKRLEINNLRISMLLKKLGNPHKYLPPVIHVAGTNGKGSTIAFIKAGLESKGKKVHVFTSPHLLDIRERILIAGEIIDKYYFQSLLKECVKVNDQKELSLFELITAVAFLAFSRNKADWTILEVGLGGRLDSTNVIKKPHLSIITPISLDHQELLGTSIKKIALEKGGIIKKKSKLIVSKQNKSALDVLKSISKNLKCKISIFGNDFDIKIRDKNFIFQTKRNKIILPLPLLKGSHQIENAAVSIAALRKLKCKKNNLIDALTNVHWPGRLQKIEKGILSPKALGIDGEIYIDGGHNVSAGVALSKWIKYQKKAHKFYVIIGMMNNKNVKEFLKPLKRYIHELIAIKIPLEKNAYEPESIVDKAEELGINSKTSENIEKAINIVISDNTPLQKKILITGSLYLVGYFLKLNKKYTF